MKDDGGQIGVAGGREMTALFEELWREWGPRAGAYLRAFHALSREDREDIAAEALGRVWLHRETIDAGLPFAPWFFTVLRRLALDALSKRSPLPLPPESFLAEPSFHAGTEEAALRLEEAEFLRHFVAALPSRDRELASLVYGQDLSVAEAARILELPRGTASWRLSLLRKALRRAWEREYGEKN